MAKGQENLKWRPKLPEKGNTKTPKEKGPGAAGEKRENASAKPATADPMIFLGRWKDSLGNDVEVERPAEENQAKSENGQTLVAKLTKPTATTDPGKEATAAAAAPEPRVLKIIVCPRAKRWRCGNGVLDRLGYIGSKDNLPTGLSWITADGRVSTWSKVLDPAEDAQKADSGDPSKTETPPAAGETSA